MRLAGGIAVGLVLLFTNFAHAEVHKILQGNWTGAQNEETDHNIIARVSAEVDPWINADISATEMRWFIRAPQTYLAQFFKLTVHTSPTNGFQLTIDDSAGLKSNGSSLDTWYAFEVNCDKIPSASDFLRAGEKFNGYSYGGGSGTTHFYLWNKVQVDTLSPAEEYEDEFTVTVSCGM